MKGILTLMAMIYFIVILKHDRWIFQRTEAHIKCFYLKFTAVFKRIMENGRNIKKTEIDNISSVAEVGVGQ